jgi:hypothetical protein
MPIDYVKMFRELVKEREDWIRKRDDAIREISRLSELIRSTIKMLPEERRAKCDQLFERIDKRPAGLTVAIRLCFTAGKDRAAKDWLTPVEIREYLKEGGFNFESYKANPLASIHTTLRRMVPHEVECKTLKGQKLYRLKAVEQWSAALAETREWLTSHEYLAIGRGPWLTALQNPLRKQNRASPDTDDLKQK